jgi:hypothetical protein
MMLVKLGIDKPYIGKKEQIVKTSNWMAIELEKKGECRVLADLGNQTYKQANPIHTYTRTQQRARLTEENCYDCVHFGFSTKTNHNWCHLPECGGIVLTNGECKKKE